MVFVSYGTKSLNLFAVIGVQLPAALSFTDSSVIIQHKETKEISGLKTGIVEKMVRDNEIKTFFTEINDEILMGELKGDAKDHAYMVDTFDEILNSIEKK